MIALVKPKSGFSQVVWRYFAIRSNAGAFDLVVRPKLELEFEVHSKEPEA